MLLFLLVILYIFEFIDIFNAPTIREIGPGYRLCGQHLGGQIGEIATPGIPAMDGVHMAALSIGSPEPRLLSVGRRYSERDANGFAIRLLAVGDVRRWLATVSSGKFLTINHL